MAPWATGEAMHHRRQARKPKEVRTPVASELPSPREPRLVARHLIASRYRTPAGDILLRRWGGSWWGWRTTHWAEVDELLVRNDVYSFTEDATFLDTSKKTPTVEPWAPTRHKVDDVLDALAPITHLGKEFQPPQWIGPVDGPPAREVVAVANGILHVPRRTLLHHSPRLFNTVSVPFAYDPAAGEPTRWLRFLHQLWPNAADVDSIAALQEFFGYVISGRVDLHKILLVVGPTRAGKGVIARVLKELVGVGNYAGPTLASLGSNFGLSPLIGKALAIIADARLGGANAHQVVERLLSISGEDPLTIDRKFKEPWTGTLSSRVIVISNELPKFGDASGAIANRFVVLNLTESFLDRENPALTSELLTELPAILNWALDGLTRLVEVGRFTEPASSRDAVIALQDLVSPVAAFVRERCIRQGEVDCDRLYEGWAAWAEANGHRPGTVQTFGRDLRAVVPGLKMGRPRDGQERRRVYQGIALVPTATDLVRNGPRSDPSYAHEREPGEEG